ncbi:MAG TPA: hypothetical protein VGN09_20735 [Vicinamibacteria bacterium]|jgi:hypothetical protein
MDAPVLQWQWLGLAGAVLLHLAFLGSARLLARDLWPLAYPALIVAASSLLAWQGLFEARWSAPVAALALVAAALVDLSRRGLPRPGRPSLVALLAGAALAFNAVWAAFPAYRYDQWNDHLTIPKLVVREGPLRAPIFNDHVFFTGCYEFLLTIPRWMSSNDVFNQSFANAFGWLLLCFGVWGAVAMARREGLSGLPPALLVTCYVAFTLPEEQAVINAKPDVVLFVAGLCLQLAVAVAARPGVAASRLAEALAGFLLVAPFALKSTWLLGGCAIGVATLLTVPVVFRRRWIWIGCALGLLAVAPYVAKNVRFFGNPLHPVQLGPFRSTFWGAGLDSYYRLVEGARSTSRYLAELAEAPKALVTSGLEAVAIPLAAVGLALAVLLRVTAADRPPLTRTVLASRAALALGVFLLIWPVAIPVYLYPRYYYGAFSVVTAIGLEMLAWAWPVLRARRASSFVAALLLLAAPLMNAGLPAKARRMAAGVFMRTRDFVAGAVPTGPYFPRLQTVNEHRRRVFPGARFSSRIALTDTPATYFLDSASLAVGGREFASYRSWAGAMCAWRLLAGLDVAYVVGIEQPFRQWPREITALLPQLTPLDDSGRVFFADPTLVRQKATTDPGCTDSHP